MSRTAANLRVFDEVADDYLDLALKPAERELLKLLGPHLHTMDMLDLGVGAGRTGYTFAALVHRYVGVDQAPRMLARAESLLGADPAVELVLADARDLSGIDGSFDLVLFSFNGIDAVGHEDRQQIFAELRSVMRPGAILLFSTHSLGALPLDTRLPRSARFEGSRLYALYAALRGVHYARKIRRINRRLDLAAARERGWVIVPGIGHDFRIDDHYIAPEHQVEQLHESGFEVETMYGVDGRVVNLPFGDRDPWLDYLCRLP